ncbi:MAG: hypothetical protein ABFS56_04095 [Pseudomonadota bacterium]
MNWYIFSAGIISIIAFLIHAFVGDKEYKLILPNNEDESNKKILSWIQGRSGWHWVSVDLLLSGIVLLLISATNYLEAEKTLALLLGIYFLVVGVTWFGTVLFSKTKNNQIIVLGQWILCFLLSGLIFLGWASL